MISVSSSTTVTTLLGRLLVSVSTQDPSLIFQALVETLKEIVFENMHFHNL